MTMIVRELGIQPYLPTWEAMKEFTVERKKDSPDECWLLEHPAVYTQGIAGKAEHVLQMREDIPIVQSDRGGQVTYHGPGQIMIYTLVDLHRLEIGIRTFVRTLETMLIQLLSEYQIDAKNRCDAPGVYVQDKKIASIGLRVKNGCTYHGAALNVGMDLGPFKNINPCGFSKLEMTQIRDFVPNIAVVEVMGALKRILIERFG